MKLYIAQIKVFPTEVSKNFATISKHIQLAKDQNADIIVFPEMALPGYIMGDIWERNDFIEECENYGDRINEMSDGIVIVYGNITTDKNKVNEDGRIRKYNSVVIASDKGQTNRIIIKTLQPNYREFDDDRHFHSYIKETFDNSGMVQQDPYHIEVDGLKIGCLLCEDSWDNDYSYKPMEHLNCDVVLNLSCSPFTHGKNEKRNRVFVRQAMQHKTPIVYVNNVGCQNNGKNVFVFDGNSCIYKTNGEIININRPFSESATTVKIEKVDYIIRCFNIKEVNKIVHFEIIDNISNVPFGLLRSTGDPLCPPVDKKFRILVNEKKYRNLCNAIIYGIDNFCEQNNINTVIIGLSGGIDSAVSAALFTAAKYPKDIKLVTMPHSRYTSCTTLNIARKIADNINNCTLYEFPIDKVCDLTKRQFEYFGMEISDLNMENVQARDRSSRILAAMASHFGGVFTCNANKTELTVGYATLYGDMGGFLAPLADVWKTDVYGLGEYLTDYFGGILPDEVFKVKPSAELSAEHNVDQGKGDPLIYPYHDLLFKSWVERWDRATPYDILKWHYQGRLEHELGAKNISDDIIRDFFNDSVKDFILDLERWWNLYDGSAKFKRVQSVPIISVSKRSFGFDHRECISKPFYSSKYKEIKNGLLGL